MLSSNKWLCIATFGSLLLLLQSVEGAKKRHGLSRQCENDECGLSQTHFALYSTVKRALQTNFNLKGKEVVPFLRAYEILKIRYDPWDSNGSNSNGLSQQQQYRNSNSTKLVQALLANQTLSNAIEMFESDQGRWLVNLYSSSIDRKAQNLACSLARIQDIKRAAHKLESSQQLASVFGQIHDNFVRKSGDRCFERACESIDLSMSRIDFVLGKRRSSSFAWRDAAFDNTVVSVSPTSNSLDAVTNQATVESSTSNNNGPAVTTTTSSATEASVGDKSPVLERELEREEQALCRFFTKTNSSQCEISGDLLERFEFTGHNHEAVQRAKVALRDLLNAYYANNNVNTTTNNNKLNNMSTQAGDSVSPQPSTAAGLKEAAKSILYQCRPILTMLEYNLAAYNWYVRSEHEYSSSSYNYRLANACPKLKYWLQMDRLCKELVNSLWDDLADYESMVYKVGSSASNDDKPKHAGIRLTPANKVGHSI